MQQNVLGLDVAVDDPVLVGVLQRPGDLLVMPQRVLDAELLLAFQPLRSDSPRMNGMTYQRKAVALAGVDQGEDVGVIQPGGEPDLGEESLADRGRRPVRGAGP